MNARRAAQAAFFTFFAALAVPLAGCGAGPAAPSAARPGTSAPLASRSASPVPVPSVLKSVVARLPRATTYTTLSEAPPDRGGPVAAGTLVAHPRSEQVLFTAPGGRPFAVLPPSELSTPTWVPVVQTVPGWDQVLLPSRPDHSAGWLPVNASLQVRYSGDVIRVSLGARTVTVLANGRALGTWTAAVGAPGTPTPVGRTFLLAQLAPPQPTYSPLIFPLGTHSDALPSFDGGPATIALHGWPDPAVFGHAVSHGCVRVPAAALSVLTRVPLGSLVVITR